MSDRERAKEWIDEISTQEVDRFLYFLNLCLSKRDLYYEKGELKKQIEKLQQELQRKDNIINDLKSSIADYQEAVGDYQDELKRKDNNWNELKEWLEIKEEKETIGTFSDVLDKIKELESK